MKIEFLRERFFMNSAELAIVWQNRSFKYGELLQMLDQWTERLEKSEIAPGAVVGLDGDFSPNSTALMLALIERGCTVVPLTESIRPQKKDFLEVSQANWEIQIGSDDSASIRALGGEPTHPLLKQLAAEQRPGLVLFSSGSTGRSKAILHDFGALLEKFRVPRHRKRMLTFLLFDHIGGVNTLFYCLSNTGLLVTVTGRRPETVCQAIQDHKVQILPTSPTFLNLLLLSNAVDSFDLSSLETITYGTEVMPESLLRKLNQALSRVNFVQTYGLSEIGILRSKSERSDSLWVKLGGEGFSTRIRNGLLEIKAQSAMLGYLNAPSPFTDDGWLMTGDVVEQKDDYFRILGRKSELINVGGEKVFPVEVESVIRMLPNVQDVCVYGEPNAITGHLVAARICLATEESLADFRKRLILFCREKLSAFKIPQKILLSERGFSGERFKKMRRQTSTLSASAEAPRIDKHEPVTDIK